MTFVPLRAHAAGDVVALGEAGARSASDLARDAAAIAAVLPEGAPGSLVLVVCADRYAQAACLLASWARGHAAALPPNMQANSIDDLSGLASVRAVLHDSDAPRGTSVRGLLRTVSAPLFTGGIPPIEGPRHLVTLFTSGSTGAPRAVQKTAEQLLGEASMLGEGPCAGATRIVATVPAIHIYGLLFGVALPLLHGGAFVRETPLHASTVAATVRRFGANALVSVPAHLRALELLDPGGLPSHLRLFSSGAALPDTTAAMLEARFGLRVTEVLGSSETGGIATRDRTGDPFTPLPGVRVGATPEGQMLLDSPFAPPDAERPWPCADRIALCDDGKFRHLGRSDQVVKVASKRVDLDEIQRALLALPGVAEAFVFADATADARGARIAAVVVAPTWSPRSLREALGGHFDPVVLPRRIVCVESLPREASGKVSRSGLLEALARATARGPRLRFDARPHGERPGAFDVHVPSDLAYFEGHFPGHPILAGIVQLQVLVAGQVQGTWPELDVVRRVTRLRFRRPIRPGDDLVLTLARPSPERVDFEVRCGASTCTSGTLHFRA